MKRGVGQGTDPWRISDTNSIPGGRQGGMKPVLVGQGAGKSEQSAAGHGGEVLDLESVLVEFERSMQLAQAVGQILKGERSVLKVDSASKVRILQRSMRLNLEGGVSFGGQVGVKGLRHFQVD